MPGMKPVCAILIVLGAVAGCGAEVTIADGNPDDGAPGTTTSSTPMGGDCSNANPYLWGWDCALSNEGTICSWQYADTGFSGSGLIQCHAGQWQEVQCPLIDTSFTRPEDGEQIETCDPMWNTQTCPWSVADAGFDCYGTATCLGGYWTSNGATYTPVNTGGAGGNGAGGWGGAGGSGSGGWGGAGGFGSTGSAGGSNP